MELKDVQSADLECSLAEWRPEDPTDIYIGVEFSIGEKGEEAADLYQCVVATPKGLEGTSSELIISDRALIVVRCFDWPHIEEHIKSILERCNSHSKFEMQERLTRYFMWEYEDYKQ